MHLALQRNQISCLAPEICQLLSSTSHAMVRMKAFPPLLLGLNFRNESESDSEKGPCIVNIELMTWRHSLQVVTPVGWYYIHFCVEALFYYLTP